MAEKGGTEIIITITICIILISIGLSGCIEDEEKDESRLRIGIRNYSSEDVNINISILQKNNANIENKNIEISGNDISMNSLYFDLKPGNYILNISTNTYLFHESNITVGNGLSNYEFSITSEKITQSKSGI